MLDDERGGNDVLIGGAGDDLIVGDALGMHPTALGGNDRLWGDPQGAASGGADVFSFTGFFGKDLVFDFRQSDGDQIQLHGYTETNGYALDLDDILDLDVSVLGGNTVIDIGASLGGAANTHTITLMGFDDPLSNADFVFA
jgi:Ca2+-binding RTX toxin-like protein